MVRIASGRSAGCGGGADGTDEIGGEGTRGDRSADLGPTDAFGNLADRRDAALQRSRLLSRRHRVAAADFGVHMQNEKPIDGADGEVERALTSLRPRSSSIDRDRLLFSAGFHSAHRKIWIWRSAAGSLAAMLLVSIFIRPQTPSPQPRRQENSNSMLAISTQKSPTTTAP